MYTDHARPELFKAVGQSGGHALDGRQELGMPLYQSGAHTPQGSGSMLVPGQGLPDQGAPRSFSVFSHPHSDLQPRPTVPLSCLSRKQKVELIFRGSMATP